MEQERQAVKHREIELIRAKRAFDQRGQRERHRALQGFDTLFL
jgi:hypothetical protein